ncbi:MAG: HlyD family efflux transporter periplasmic adaptor subunit [bacterium]|nr:HlyD family efflux transporter periplasmic adaptor subunit [bacterium]
MAQHKFLIGIIIAALAVGGTVVYRTTRDTNEPVRYLLATVERGTLVVSVSGSGQVAVTNQVDVKAKTSGDVVTVAVKEGGAVAAGALLAQLDTRDAQKAVRDAQTNLESAQLALEKLRKPPDALAVLQAENALTSARASKQDAEDDLAKSREDGFTAVASAFLDLPAIMTGLHDILYGMTVSGGSQGNIDAYADAVKGFDDRAVTYRNDADRSERSARTAYDANFTMYKSLSRLSAASAIEQLITQTHETTRSAAEAVKAASNLVQFYKDELIERSLRPHVLADAHLTAFNGYTSKLNTHISALFAATHGIATNTEAIASDERTIAERTAALADLRAGADALDLQSQELVIRQRVAALTDARERLTDSSVRAPFGGVVAALDVKRGDTVSANAVVATLITTQRIAEITLNEVDVAKVRVNQRATLTFDAIPELELTGVVSAIDAIGTTSAGVVSYTVEIGFDAQDDRVKPGMSVTAVVTTEAKPDVLLVPNAAVKAQGETQIVEVVEGSDRTQLADRRSGVVLVTPPRRQAVVIGVANDDVAEVLNGLAEGDVVVIGTVRPSATTNAAPSQQPGTFRIPGLPGGRR